MPREDVSHHPNRQQTWVQSLPCDWHRHRPFVHQVLLRVEEVRWNGGGAPTWGLRRRCQGRGRGRYSRGARRWAGSPCPTGHNKMGGIEWRWGRPLRGEPPLQTHSDTDQMGGESVQRYVSPLQNTGRGRVGRSQVLSFRLRFPYLKKTGRLDIHIESRVVSREIYVCLYWFIRWRYVNAEKYVFSSVWLIR